MKRCPKCGETKSFAEWRKNKGNKDGLHSYCALCSAIKVREDRTNTTIRVSVKVTQENFFDFVEKGEDDHWKYVGPGGSSFRALPATWCSDEGLGFPCINPEHQTSTGTLPHATEQELWEDDEAEGEMGSFNVLSVETKEKRGMRGIDESLWHEASDEPATKFLRERGFNKYGEALVKGPNARK